MFLSGFIEVFFLEIKVNKVTVTNCFNLPNVRKVTKVTCPNLVKLTSDLVAFDVNPTT